MKKIYILIFFKEKYILKTYTRNCDVQKKKKKIGGEKALWPLI